MLGVRMCGCVGKTEESGEKEQKGHQTTPLPDLLGQNACLNTLRHEQNSFTVTLAATMEREFSLSRLSTQTRTYTMQVVASPDNSFIVLLGLFVPCVECIS